MMHVSRGVFDVETTVRKLSSRFRRPPQASRPEWPVISAARPMFYLLRFFGLAPFEISDDRFIPGSYAAMYSFLWIVVYIYVVYKVLVDNMTKRESVMIETIQTAKVIFNCSIAILNLLIAVWARKEFIRVLNVVKNFDSRIRDLGHARKEGVTMVWVWSTGIFTAFLWVTVNRTGMAAFTESWVYNIAYIFNYLVNSLSTIKFSSTVLLLGQRFKLLNEIANRNKASTTVGQKSTIVDSKVIQQLHNSLMNAGESLGSQYSWPLLLWLMNLCVHSVSNLYFLVNWLMVTPEWASTRWPLVHCLTWWLVAFVAQLLLLHIACHFTSTEANSIGSIMITRKSLASSRNYVSTRDRSRCGRTSGTDDARSGPTFRWSIGEQRYLQRVESSLHLINRRLNFSAAGCFYVNLPLLSSITAILTTYLALLMQYQG